MTQFDQSKWKKNQLLKEQGLINENQATTLAGLIDNAIEQVDPDLSYKDLASAIAQILKSEYGSHNFGPFMEVLHAELGIDESLNEAETSYDTYTVNIITSDPEEGGPDEDFTEKVKVDASLTGDDIRDSIKDTVYDMGYRRLYKLNYEKA